MRLCKFTMTAICEQATVKGDFAEVVTLADPAGALAEAATKVAEGFKGASAITLEGRNGEAYVLSFRFLEGCVIKVEGPIGD